MPERNRFNRSTVQFWSKRNKGLSGKGVQGRRVTYLKKRWHGHVDKVDSYVEDWKAMDSQRMVFQKKSELVGGRGD